MLTLHCKCPSRHWDIIFPLCGKAVMWQIEVLWQFHQRVICEGTEFRNKWKEAGANNKTNVVCSYSTWRADIFLTCNQRSSTQGKGRAGAELKLRHHLTHDFVHCVNQTVDHRVGLLMSNKYKTIVKYVVVFHCLALTGQIYVCFLKINK